MDTGKCAESSSSEELKLLVVDLETTGLDPKHGSKPIEVAAALFSVKHREVLQTVSFLIPNDTNEAEHVNRISPAVTKERQPWQAAMKLFFDMAEQSDYALAHNCKFDSKWFGVDPLPAMDIPWLDSMTMNWGHMSGRSLRDLALNNGITVTPDHHRAGPDVQLLTSVLSAREDLVEILDDALIPRHPYWARVSYEQRGLAKTAGFQWNSERKQWIKDLTEKESESFEFVCMPIKVTANERAANVR